MRDPKLEVWHDNGTIYLRLTNRSPAPITVDGDLVLGVHVSFLDKNGESLEAVAVKRPPGVEDPTVDPMRRLKTLQPGETVERTICLKQPFRYLSVAFGFRAGAGTREHLIAAGEGWRILRQPERTRGVKAWYSITFSRTWEGITQYLGARPEELGLYMGELEAQCSVPEP